MNIKINQNKIDTAFKISIFFKGLDGLLEFAGSLLLLIIGRGHLNWFINTITRHELMQDPRDYIANGLIKLGNSLSLGSYYSITAFLLIHGGLKIFIIIMLFFKKLWAYPAAMITFSLFAAYQIYQLSYSYSLSLLLLTILDFLVIILTYLEYKNLLKRRHLHSR